MQNLTIDYSTDTNGRILSMNYNETGGFNGNLTYVYDNYGNVADLLKDDGNPAKAILINLIMVQLIKDITHIVLMTHLPIG